MSNTNLWQPLRCQCPHCHDAPLFKGKFSTDVQDTCPACGFTLGDHDSGDGPAFFLNFALCLILIPLALLLEKMSAPPLWLHAVLWSIVGLGICIGGLRPIKSFMISSEYRQGRDGS